VDWSISPEMTNLSPPKMSPPPSSCDASSDPSTGRFASGGFPPGEAMALDERSIAPLAPPRSGAEEDHWTQFRIV
jgi:hypothetical protein